MSVAALETSNDKFIPGRKYIATHQSISNQKGYRRYQDWEYDVFQESLAMKWIWKVCCIYHCCI